MGLTWWATLFNAAVFKQCSVGTKRSEECTHTSSLNICSKAGWSQCFVLFKTKQCFGLMGAYNVLSANNTFILILCCVVFAILIITFCSLSVLCVLIRPRLGESGREKEKADQLKLRAFHTITAILGVLWLCCISYLIGIALNESTFLSKGVKCVIDMTINWFNLPSSLILLLLYLQRTGKLSYQWVNTGPIYMEHFLKSSFFFLSG